MSCWDTGLSLHTPLMLPGVDQSKFLGYYLNPYQERETLSRFFDDIHTAIPILQKDRFLRLYDEGRYDYDLVVAINTITVKLLGPMDFWPSEDVDMCINSLLMTTAYESDFSASQTSLIDFQRECMLAYYDFHEFPGPSAWMRISRLTRRAYAMGLNQIENPELCSAYDAGVATEDEIEDWRYVWWCVYCFDSYSNMSLGTPFIVDTESITTALVRRSSDDDHVPPLPKLFLPDDIGELWRTTQEVMSSSGETEFNLNILTTTVLRQAGNILRFRYTKKQVKNKAEILTSNLASLRLALPRHFLNPARNALIAESSLCHHIRLTSLFRLHMTRLIIFLPQDFAADKTEWLNNWQQILGACQDVVTVVEQWNNQFSSHVDPAICLIAFVTLWITNLHRRCIPGIVSPLMNSLLRAENNLILFLEQFSRMWALPKLLLQLFKISSNEDALTYSDVDQVLNQIRMPLNPKIMRRACGLAPDVRGGFEKNAAFIDMRSLETQSTGVWT
ncbi:uncharacterized protein F4822DRAFT_404901 [Hypoxylon trugodes]|uniref:uncharacterized protein n=1 Tax=Hypoxylon trugodes TaxID=326681 RepID=UPI00219BC9F3|nr:uncharacterized protein F4822DRAFT_404901 [Hypoxylon trugodes]KAI1389083.1 hypothetical protein F4822DRAFT_404901 [Hypoxylon trugodes]